MSSWGRPMFLGCLARPGLLFKNDQLLSLGFPSRENWQKNQLISIILQWLTELSWEDGTWGHVWSPVWSENEHSRSAQDGWGQEENHGWGYGDIVFRETSKLYSTEMNNKSVQKKNGVRVPNKFEYARCKKSFSYKFTLKKHMLKIHNVAWAILIFWICRWMFLYYLFSHYANLYWIYLN